MADQASPRKRQNQPSIYSDAIESAQAPAPAPAPTPAPAPAPAPAPTTAPTATAGADATTTTTTTTATPTPATTTATATATATATPTPAPTTAPTTGAVSAPSDTAAATKPVAPPTVDVKQPPKPVAVAAAPYVIPKGVKFEAGYSVSTYAGSGQMDKPLFRDAPPLALSGSKHTAAALKATFNDARAICVDSDHNCYVADTNFQRIRKIIPAPPPPPQVAVTFTTPFTALHERNAPPAEVKPLTPAVPAVPTVADPSQPAATAESAAPIASASASTPAPTTSAPAPASTESGSAAATSGGDAVKEKTDKTSGSGVATAEAAPVQPSLPIPEVPAAAGVLTVAGNGKYGGRDGRALESVFSMPCGVCVDTDFTVYITDMNNHCM